MKRKGAGTLLSSVLMSAPGPAILGVGLLFGKSNTQIADFLRRSIELFALTVAFAAYRRTEKANGDPVAVQRIERAANLFTGIAMAAAGIIMLGITLFSAEERQGSVIPGLVIALLGVMANTIFWIRYRILGIQEKNSILLVQARLYRAKTFVDLCVCTALLSVLIAPASPFSAYLDVWGSAVVSLYLAFSGIRIIAEKLRVPH